MNSNGKKINPYRTLLLSFGLTILVGSFLLYLPVSVKREISYLDALFTATSAVTVTGLTVLNTAEDFTMFGKFVILILIQIGGLGYMTLSTFFLILLRRRVGLKERLIVSEALEYPSLYGLVRFLKRVFAFVFTVEIFGAVLLSTYFGIKGVENPLFNGLFHAVSAFNNAGFSTFKNGLIDFRGDVFVNTVVISLIVLGGIGFFVINEIYLFLGRKIRNLSLHTHIVLLMTFILIFFGTLGLIFTEWGNSKGIWNYSLKEKLLSSLFMSVSARTAGFNTVDVANLSESSQFLLSLLMFIGASPGGTGGGIKTTTFGVIIIAIYSYIRGREQAVVFNRSISERVIKRALVILSLSVFYITFVNLLLDKIENKDFLATLFEVISAFSTVGLSFGNPQGLSFCADFSPLGKIIIMITMLVGRVGILGFAIALMKRETVQHVRYPEGRILV